MSINHKIILIISVSFTVMILSFYALMFFIVLPAFINLERVDYEKNLSRVEETFKRELYHLQNFCNDWANWDDAHDFLNGENDDFISVNIDPTTFITANINKIYFLDNYHGVFFGKDFDLIEQVYKEGVASNDLGLFQSGLFYEEFLKNPEKHYMNGILTTAQGLFLVAAHRVFRTDGTGDSPGVLIFGREINEHYVLQLREQVKLDYDIVYGSDLPLQDIYDNLDDKHVFFGDEYIKVSFSHIVHLYKPFYNMEGEVAFYNKVIYPSEIIRQGHETITIAVISLALSSFLIMAIFILLMKRIVTDPIKAVTAHVMALEKEQDYSARLNIDRTDELGILGNAIDFFTSTISRQTRMLNDMALKDGLTGIFNRRYFDTAFEKEWNRHCRGRMSLALFMLDVDYFKRFNDFYGHQKGDDALIKIARVLENFTRRTGEFPARYGGEEFVMVLPGVDVQAASAIADTLNRAVLDLNIDHGDAPETGGKITVSIGVAVGIPECPDKIKGGDISRMAAQLREKFIHAADDALYRAKDRGRNCYVLDHVV
ncbi:MAG: diguanylate cyclase [Desulfamplus sp.]|nr:diguanylate cyclase [Desulfamplus sp.]